METDFGWALAKLRDGYRVRRAGWNGKGMWLSLTAGSTVPASAARPDSAMAKIGQETGGEVVEILPHIDMRTAQGELLCGWLASQTDMLAFDWELAE